VLCYEFLRNSQYNPVSRSSIQNSGAKVVWISNLLPGSNHKSDLCVTVDFHLLSARFPKKVMTYLLLHHPDALVLTTSPLLLEPSPNGSDSHFNRTKSSSSPFCDQCVVTLFVRRQKAIWRYISAKYSD
jgi:hypothetical protein